MHKIIYSQVWQAPAKLPFGLKLKDGKVRGKSLRQDTVALRSVGDRADPRALPQRSLGGLPPLVMHPAAPCTTNRRSRQLPVMEVPTMPALSPRPH